MVITDVVRGSLESAIEDTAERISAMIERQPDMAQRLPRSDWTVGEAAAHVATTQGIFLDLATGGSHPYTDPSIEQFAALNRQAIDQVQGHSGGDLAAMIRTRTGALLVAMTDLPDDQLFDAPIGRLTTTQLASYCLSHLLMHGYTISRALGERSPIEASHVRLVMPFLEAAMPFSFSNLSDRALEACVDFRVGEDTRFGLVLRRDSATIVDAPLDRVDVHIYARPVPFLLVGFGLESHWWVLARGGMVAWGRRPWVALQLKNALPNL